MTRCHFKHPEDNTWELVQWEYEESERTTRITDGYNLHPVADPIFTIWDGKKVNLNDRMINPEVHTDDLARDKRGARHHEKRKPEGNFESNSDSDDGDGERKVKGGDGGACPWDPIGNLDNEFDCTEDIFEDLTEYVTSEGLDHEKHTETWGEWLSGGSGDDGS